MGSFPSFQSFSDLEGEVEGKKKGRKGFNNAEELVF